ncbi:sorbosone dehydrogenase family protein [Arthrobacter sp. GMC3]|uniref:PQQ-dependent sugar dehydrogenase n=1 Tax=Arthrobacter sp. GMC3 TaxID=2058894 RepID=UPI0021581D01|nr:PQQ-dependent sugar dehydrogenase [Arthrobacter sp. GMC3]
MDADADPQSTNRRKPRRRPAWLVLAALAAGTLALTSCQPPSPSPPPVSSSPPAGPAAAGDIATGLAAPWSMVPLADGTFLVSERDSGRILEVGADGTKRTVGEVAGVVHQGEGGLLGLALHVGSCPSQEPLDPNNPCFDVYAYLTTADDNRVVRMPLLGESGNRGLGPATAIITGIPKAGNHNGGRIAFGPEGLLYTGTGDAGNGNNAQNPASLGGKILRTTRDGGIPSGNPFPNSPVWSLGHRNVQGIAWDAQGRMWASEFGQNTWDELNQIRAGNNYGWPVVEGMGSDSRFTNPVLQWPTSEASPSGIAIAGTTLYMAALRRERPGPKQSWWASWADCAMWHQRRKAACLS